MLIRKRGKSSDEAAKMMILLTLLRWRLRRTLMFMRPLPSLPTYHYTKLQKETKRSNKELFSTNLDKHKKNFKR